MTFPLWGLVIFVVWTIAIVVALISIRIRHLAMGGAVKEFAIPNDDSLLWRLYRVQSNLVENLPLYLSIVFLLIVRNVAGTAIDFLISIYITFRLLHSIIHIAGMNPLFRVICLAIQYTCLISLMILAIIK
ncbi:MAG: MAPEG family protein [Synechococcales bacterium]|nr:MAPEG family protein [Synechococcales bacterium]